MATLVPWGSRLTQLLDDAFLNGSHESTWSAAHANIVELEDEYEITLDLPGLGSDDFQIEYEDGQLRIMGERRFEHEEKEGRTFHRVERSYGKFSRAFALPRDVDPEKIEAKYENGVLRVAVPKAESSKVRKIEVK